MFFCRRARQRYERKRNTLSCNEVMTQSLIDKTVVSCSLSVARCSKTPLLPVGHSEIKTLASSVISLSHESSTDFPWSSRLRKRSWSATNEKMKHKSGHAHKVLCNTHSFTNIVPQPHVCQIDVPPILDWLLLHPVVMHIPKRLFSVHCHHVELAY